MSLNRAIHALRQRKAGYRTGRDAGTTLIEMMVVLFLLGILCSMLMLFTTNALKATRHTDAQQQDTLQARSALDAMTRNLRSAVPLATSPVTPAFVQASSTSVTFYANNGTVTGATTNTGPTLMRYYFDTTARTLVEQSTPATGTSTPYTWNSANMTTRILARNLPNPQPTRPDITGAQTSGGPIFSFYDRTATAIAVDSSGNVSTLNLPNIRQIEVWLSVQSGTSSSQVTSVDSQVQIVTGYDPDGTTVS